jgi:hypothetical protein
MPPRVTGAFSKSAARSGSRDGSGNASTINQAGRAAGNDVGVDEGVAVRRHAHVVELAEGGEFAAFGEAAHHRHLELQDADRALVDKGAATRSRRRLSAVTLEHKPPAISI